jgi:hypothetical protein
VVRRGVVAVDTRADNGDRASAVIERGTVGDRVNALGEARDHGQVLLDQERADRPRHSYAPLACLARADHGETDVALNEYL